MTPIRPPVALTSAPEALGCLWVEPGASSTGWGALAALRLLSPTPGS
jgi:hypothetical protein